MTAKNKSDDTYSSAVLSCLDLVFMHNGASSKLAEEIVRSTGKDKLIDFAKRDDYHNLDKLLTAAEYA